MNAPTPPPGSAAAAALLASVAPSNGREGSAPPTPAAEEVDPVASTSTPLAPSADDLTVTAPAKRKSRTTDPAAKRYKASSSAGGAYMGTAGSSSSTKEKDYSPPLTRLSDLGGVQPCVEKMLELVAMPICHPGVYVHTGVQPPRGVLLHGPPGCGKTLLANAIAGVC